MATEIKEMENGSIASDLESSTIRETPHKVSKTKEVKSRPLPHSKQVDSNTTKQTTEPEKVDVLEKLKDQLQIYGIYLIIFDQITQNFIPNPKMTAIQEIVKKMDSERAERVILTFLSWLKDAKNVRDKYAALATSLRELWE